MFPKNQLKKLLADANIASFITVKPKPNAPIKKLYFKSEN